MGSANFYTEVIAYNSTEAELMKAVISYITGLDNRITCSEDPDYEYNREDRGDAYIPTFNFYIGSKLIFTISRDVNLRNPAGGFGIYVKTSSQTLSSKYVGDINGSKYYNVKDNRAFRIAYIISDNFILIDFHQNFSSGNSIPGIAIIYTISDTIDYVAYKIIDSASSYNRSGIFNISGILFYNFSNASSGTFVSRFSYKSVPGKIDYVKNCVYATAGQKQFNIMALYDCTEVTAGDTLSLDDGAYIAVGTNQIVKILDS